MTYQRPLLNFTALVIVLLPNMSNGQIGYILWSSFLLVQMPYVSPLQLEHIIFDTQHVTVGKNGQIGYISCCCGFMVSGFCFGFCSDPDCPGQAGSKKTHTPRTELNSLIKGGRQEQTLRHIYRRTLLFYIYRCCKPMVGFNH